MFGKAVKILFLLAILMFGLNGPFWSHPAEAFSVDVKNFSYSDDSGRFIAYDFSAGSAVGNSINLEGNATITRGAGEVATTYAWGLPSGAGYPATTITLDTANKKATVSPVDPATGGLAAITAGGAVPAAVGTTGWFHTIQLANFNVDLTSEKAYEFNIGLGRGGEGYNEGSLTVAWVKGLYNGTYYGTPTLIIQARVRNTGSTLWSSTPIVRTGLTPATTTLMFDLSVFNGNNFSAAARINEENMTNLGGYTLPSGQFLRFPDLFPFLWVGEANTSSGPQAAQVSSQHWNDAQGNVYHAWPRVDDPGQALYSAVSLSSQGYLTETPLSYNSAAGYWSLSGTLFADGFNDNAVDASKWSTKGTGVAENEGVLKVTQAVQDQVTAALSRTIVINPYAKITVQRKAKVHYANSYFDGLFALYFGNTADFAAGFPNVSSQAAVVVSHANYDHSGGGEQTAHGFYLGRYAAHFTDPVTSAAITPIWDTWFDEKVVYDPITGAAELYINSELKATVNVGALPPTARYMNVFLQAWGWYTGHYNYSDDITVSQPWTGGNIFLSANTPPANPVTFNFILTKKAGGTDTVSKTISGYVTEFASNLQPTGNIATATPTFSWTGISGVTNYSVQVSDANGNRIWNKYAIPPGTTSMLYNNDSTGPALVSGQTYHYEIVSSIVTDGLNNDSFAKGSFTYGGGGGTTISFNGWVKSVPSWPAINDAAAVTGATVNALNEAGPPPFTFTSTNAEGAFAITGIPASTTFRVVIPTPASTTYIPVLSKFMNWNADIQALLPFALFTQGQYNAFGNTPGTGMILGRVALQNSPATFLSGATITATQWLNGSTTSTTYPVTYTGGGSSTGPDGIYMVKNVPPGTMVQLTAALIGHTFEFNGAIMPTQPGFISEESFFATAVQQPSPFNVYSYHHQSGTYYINLFVDDPSQAFTGVTVNGPGLTGDVALVYTNGRWLLSDAGGIVLGTTLPTGARTYNFTAATGGPPVTGSKTVSVYVEGYATNLSPTASVNATPTFSWTGIAGAAGYAVILYDTTAGGAWVWTSQQLAPDQTSVSYNGSALTAGHAYQYLVVSSVNTDGNSNASFAQGQFTYTGGATTVTVSGTVRNWTGAVIPGGVSVSLVGDPTKTTTASTADGTFSLPGIPVSTAFSLKFSSAGYLDLYSVDITLTGDMNVNADGYGGSSPFLMPTADNLTALGAKPDAGKALITGRVSDQTYRYSSNIGGATVTAQGLSKTYPVIYRDPFGALSSTPSTWGNGYYYILNVDAGDTVTLTTAKAGWAFGSRTFHTLADAVTQGRIFGTAPGYDASLGGFVKNSGGAAVSGATLALNGDPNKSTAAAGDGSYTFSGLPRDANFYVKITAAGYVPAYAGPVNLQGNISGVNLLMLTAGEMAGFGVASGNGLIGCTVMDQAMNPLSGATITLTSKSGTSYTVNYTGGGGSTPASGKFLVPNILQGDVIKIEVTRSGYAFNPVYMDGFGDAFTEKMILGTVTGPVALKGDLNGDDLVNLADAILALQVTGGMNPGSIRPNYGTSGADVNGDKRIGLVEVIYIMQKVAGVRGN